MSDLYDPRILRLPAQDRALEFSTGRSFSNENLIAAATLVEAYLAAGSDPTGSARVGVVIRGPAGRDERGTSRVRVNPVGDLYRIKPELDDVGAGKAFPSGARCDQASANEDDQILSGGRGIGHGSTPVAGLDTATVAGSGGAVTTASSPKVPT